VLIPYRAYSAATIMALGANQIIMHKFGALGPIDPTVTNDFNPIEVGSNRKLGISVEDVKAYISFIKDTFGINHEEELVKAAEILANKIHPLALGNVERFIAQARMIARKLLKLHTTDDDHVLDKIIEALASKLYFHGHPINRTEAQEIGLSVLKEVPDEIEAAMWDLYTDFEAEMKFRDIYDPVSELIKNVAPNAGTPGIFTEVVRIEENINWAKVESARLSSSFETTHRYSLIFDPQCKSSIDTIQLAQEWSRIEASPHP
jgi:hypothetical protein